MYFKKLEIIGFKSFEEKTEINFEPGITAIVGPNGCGKTNISDAIRWVLGEQSAKSLRGQRMEDIIFNGTEVHKPLSMAEVSLTLNNEDKIIPIEYSEVTVIRCCYRSGESEYFINKNPCRLKDIHELFMDTGIGTESYSVMEQGKVDLIISSRPEDRRFVLEEAAGIAKYNARRDASVRKLELTEQNLLRIDDIIAEVKREIISMKRQVTKAEKYKESYEKLKGLETNLGVKKYNAIKSEIGAFQEKISQLKEEAGKLNIEVAQEESKEEVLHLKVIDIEKAIASARDRFLAAAENVNNIENQSVTSRERIEHLKQRCEKASQEIKDIQEKIIEIQKKIESDEEEERKLLEIIKETESSLAEKENAFTSRLTLVETKEKELEEIKNRLFEKVRESTVLNNEIQKINISFADRQRRLAKKGVLLPQFNLLVELDRAYKSYSQSISSILKEIEKITGRNFAGLIPELIKIEAGLNLKAKKEEIEIVRQKIDETEEGEKFSLEMKALEEEKSQLDALLLQKREAIDSLEREREELKIKVDNYAGEFQNLKKGLEEARDIKEKTKLSFAGLQEKKRGMELHLKTSRERLGEYTHNKSKLEEEIALAGTEIEELKNTFETFGKEKENSLKKKASFKEEMDRLEEERKQANLVFREEEERLRRERANSSKKLEELHQLEITRTQKEAELFNLKERMLNLYQVDLEKMGTVPLGTVPNFLGCEAGKEIINEEEARIEIESLREKIDSMGSVNIMAIEENKELEDRFSLLKREREDILKAKEELREVISRINHTSREMFSKTIEKVREEFHTIFRLLFNGGKADLILQEGDILECGIDIVARPPGKNLGTISQLSGGEKALTAIALLFALFRIRPSPFCVLDEIDAPLDDSNIGRFGALLKEFVKTTQFIIITHNKRTISLAQVIYGITMEEPGVSKILSVKFKDSYVPEPSTVSS